MDPIAAALDAYRPIDPTERLCRAVREAGRLSLNQVTQRVIRDEAKRREAVACAVERGKIRIEVTPTGARPRVDLVWVE